MKNIGTIKSRKKSFSNKISTCNNYERTNGRVSIYNSIQWTVLMYFLSLVLSSPAWAQNTKATDEWIEDQFENTESAFDISEITEQLEQLTLHPISINTASESELHQLILLNELQIQNLIYYREKYGPLISKYELLNINGFDEKTLYTLEQFIRIQPANNQSEWDIPKAIKSGRNELILRNKRVLEPQEGYLSRSKKSYLGSRDQVYGRYKFYTRNKIKAGFTFEKDAGEELFKGSQPQGFDFYSGYLCINDYKKINTLVIGDFKVAFGQGLNLWNGFSLGKSAYATNIRKIASYIRPYSSSNENNYFRGMATSVDFKKASLHLFFSHKKIDTRIATNKNDQNIFFYSRIFDGLHNTRSGIETRKNAKETFSGIYFDYRHKHFKIGIGSYLQQYSIPYHPDKKPYSFFLPEGKNTFLSGADYTYTHSPISIFGELSINPTRSISFVQGILAHLSSSLSLAALYRHYDKKYYNPYSNAFGNNTNNSNENGFYMGLHWSPFRKISIAAYRDICSYPWLKYHTDAPSYGNEQLVQIDYFHSPRFNVSFRYKHRFYQQNKNEINSHINQLDSITKEQFRISLTHTINAKWSLKSRIEHTILKTNPKTSGTLAYQDIIYSFSKYPIKIYARIALFDTDNYQSRLYAYENAPLYNYTFTALYYSGTRHYLLIKYQAGKNLSLWCKLAQTHYSNQNSISSGLNKINGNKKTELHVQVRLKF